MTKNNPHVVIVGGGFGGVYTAKYLLRSGFTVTLINERNYFTFTPLLHEVATGVLTVHDIVFEFESFFHHKQFHFVRGCVTSVDTKERKVFVGEHAYSYDMLVLATGARTNDTMIPGSKHAYPLKTIQDAIRLKRRIVELAQGPDAKLDVTIVGGGPTGVELALELQPFLKHLQSRDERLRYNVRLIHPGDYVLGRYSPKAQRYAEASLKRSGIQAIPKRRVQEISSNTVRTDEEQFHSDLTILTAGVIPCSESLGGSVPMTRKHIRVEPTLQVESQSNVFALGDVIQIGDNPVPKLAQTAAQEARVVAENIRRLVAGKELKTYNMKLSGQLVSLGYGRGAGDLGGLFIKGPLAWFVWRTVYLMKTPGTRNKLRVAFSWTLDLFQGRTFAEE